MFELYPLKKMKIDLLHITNRGDRIIYAIDDIMFTFVSLTEEIIG